MVSKLSEEQSYLVSTDVGIMQVKIQGVTGYDVEDIVRDKARSYARSVQMLSIGKMIDPTSPTAERTLSSSWLNNTEEMPK